MYDFMVNRKELGAYQAAFDQSQQLFAKKDPNEMAKNCNVDFDPSKSIFIVPSLGHEISVSYPEGKINFKYNEKTPLWQWSLIVLNHLSRGNNGPLSNRLISYRELEDGNVFYPAFYKNAILPLTGFKTNKSEAELSQIFASLGGTLVKGADLAIEFEFLPRFPVTFKIWEGDEEIAPSANILFDASSNHYLHTEDIAVAGELISRFFLEIVKV